tara:strand:+ start:2741 stop:3022 length:282 start_codon:yes stop_codon:yes gene_type:complete
MFKIEGDRVISPRGDVLAEKIYGEWQTKDAAVLDFLAGEDKPKKKTKPKAKATPDPVLERARDENGHFISDDPETEINEAWVVKTVKKVMKKK